MASGAQFVVFLWRPKTPPWPSQVAHAFPIVEFAPLDADHPTPPSWHRTRTVDYVVILSGEIDLMLEDSVVHLKAGDTVVQQATNHAWVNRVKETCRLAFVLMDEIGRAHV